MDIYNLLDKDRDGYVSKEELWSSVNFSQRKQKRLQQDELITSNIHFIIKSIKVIVRMKIFISM